MSIRSRTLATRFSLLYVALVVSVLAVGAAAYWTIVRWGDVMGALTQDYGKALDSEHLRGDVNQLAKEITELVIGDANAPEDLARLSEAITTRLARLRTGERTEGEQRALDDAALAFAEIESRIGPLRAGIGNIVRPGGAPGGTHIGPLQALLGAGDRDAAFQLSEVEIEKKWLPVLQEALDRLRHEYLLREQRSLDGAAAAQRQATMLSMGILVLAAGQLAFFTVFLQRRFRRPIEDISEGTRRMREGDLDHEIVLPYNDELGALADDITEMARSLRESREKLVRNERLAAVGEVAAYLAHNLRNPLAGIRSASQAALEEAENVALCRETYQDIILTVDKLATWTQDILRYISPLPPQRTTVRAEELVQAVRRLALGTLASRGVEIREEVEQGLPALSVDLPAMEQALHALVVNAAEAVAPGACVRLRAERADGGVTLSVIDTGKGMSTEISRHAAEPFYTTKPKGMGLGLAMADKVARAHEGVLHITSLPEQGTTVSLHLPGARS